MAGFAGRLLLLLLGRGRGPADAEFFLHEDFGEAEAAAAEFAGFIVGEEFDALFSYFGEEDLPGFLAEVVNGKEGTVLAFAAPLFVLAAALVFFTAEAFLLAAGLFCIAAGLFGFPALLRRELLGLGVAGRAFFPGRPGITAFRPGRTGFAGFPVAGGAGGVSGERLAGEDADFGRGSVIIGSGLGFHRWGGGRSSSFFLAGHGCFSDVLHDFGGKMP